MSTFINSGGSASHLVLVRINFSVPTPVPKISKFKFDLVYV